MQMRTLFQVISSKCDYLPSVLGSLRNLFTGLENLVIREKRLEIVQFY